MLTATLVISVLTFVGMISGLLRDVLIARWFGASAIVDAFLVALIVPTVAENFLGLALKDTLIPIFSAIQAGQGKVALTEAANGIAGWVSLVTLGVIGISFFQAKWVIGLLAPGLLPSTAQLAMDGLRIASLTILFTMLIHLTGSLLQLKGYYAIVAARSLTFNSGIILGGLVLGAMFQPQGLLLGMTIGISAQLILHWAILRADGLPIGGRGRIPIGLPSRLFTLLIPILIVTSTLQINVLAERNLASSLSPGSIAVLFYAYRMVMLPVNMVAEPLAASIFPTLAGYYSQGRVEEVNALLIRVLRLVMLVMIPITITFIVLREPLVVLILRHGAFTIENARITANALAGYSLGLIGFAGSTILLRFFYATNQAYRPAILGLLSSGLYIGLALFLIRPLAQMGLALAMGCASLCNFLGLIWLYIRYFHPPMQIWKILIQHTLRVALSGTIMGGSMLVFDAVFSVNPNQLIQLVSFTLLKLGGGILVFTILLAIWGVTEVRILIQAVVHQWKIATQS